MLLDPQNSAVVQREKHLREEKGAILFIAFFIECRIAKYDAAGVVWVAYAL